ncbi:MAG: helicase C-terminal domain-containing protein [Chloroflexota bacterium]
MTSLITLDIETTGLSAERDAIIEIGAVRFNDRRVEAEFSTLVNPGRAIPEFISDLTGISSEMVRNAPRLADVLHELQDFVGDAPLIGHNVRFDLGFFERYNLFPFNDIIDTYELASVLMPAASRYNLGALGQQLGILMPATHRALDDARVTQAAFMRLYELAYNLPLDLIAEIVRLGEPLDWDANWVFQSVMRSRYKEGIPEPGSGARTLGLHPASDNGRQPPPVKLVEDRPIPVNQDEAASILEYGGAFSHYFEAFEQRPEQVEMLRAVTDALSVGYHAMIEAGTGVGKSFAYLVPAALFASRNNTRVVVSTNTINLQDQLIKKDIPDLRAATNLDVRAAVLKGRSNYLCPRRLEHVRKHGPQNKDEMRVLTKVLIWLLTNQSGDRNEINLTGPIERQVWNRMSAEDDACTNETCVKRTGGACPFYKARQAAQSAHILVVNHALLLADVAVGSRVLPEYQYLIVDEAHHLESATTSALSFRLTESDVERLMREAGGVTSGVLGRLLAETSESLRPSEQALLSQKVKRASDLAFRMQSQAHEFFYLTGQFAALLREGQPPSNYAYQERIQPSTRTLPGWDEVEAAWAIVDETAKLLLNAIEELYKTAADLYANGLETLEDLIADLANFHRRLTEAEGNVSALISDPLKGMVYWVEIQPNNDKLSLNAAPLHVGALIQKYLWHEKNSIILTSATLTTQNGFEYVRNALSAEEAEELMLGSPFDYEGSTLLYIPNDIPEPNANGYQPVMDRSIVQLAMATGGRMLVLFTSYAQLKRTSKAITGPLAREEITVFGQGEGASPNTLLESFRETDRSVLLGTRSFWEGVDIPGQALSALVITKLPFDVPSDPLIAARSELYEDAFSEYYLPEAILKFRQGFGRLIRTQYDRGVVTILDKRVMTKAYGRAFLESLPQCTSRSGPLANLPKLAAQWLNM